MFRRSHTQGGHPVPPGRESLVKKGSQIWLSIFVWAYRLTRSELTMNWFPTLRLITFIFIYCNTSKKLIFPRPIASCCLSQPRRNALWAGLLSAFALVSWQLCVGNVVESKLIVSMLIWSTMKSFRKWIIQVVHQWPETSFYKHLLK